MKTLLIIPLVLMSLVSFPIWGLSMDELFPRKYDGLYYQKFTDIPFTGEIDEGLERGLLKNGKKEGFWQTFYKDGKLDSKRNYKNGKRHGLSIYYYENGQIGGEGYYKNGVKEP